MVKRKETRTVKWVNTQQAAVTLAVLLTLLQTFHTTIVLYEISHIELECLRWIQAFGLAFITEAFILFYAIRRRKIISIIFALLSVSVNLMYYLGDGSIGGLQFTVAVVVSIVIPAGIYKISDEV